MFVSSPSPVLLILVNNVNKVQKVNKKGKTLSIIDFIFSEYNKNVIYEHVQNVVRTTSNFTKLFIYYY